MDPPRPEAANAIRVARDAGIRVIMITGDAAPTSLAIAERIGLPCRQAVLGGAFDQLSDMDLKQMLRDDILFARTTPEQKLRLVRLLQEAGEIVGMTGDGVNDAPALKQADIGIAMGKRGTDVAKGASDMVLTDDNFASIINAIEEGRRQFDNIRKFVRYILSSATGEVVAILTNIASGAPLILLPVQILWMNMVTDGVTAIALGLEPGEPDRMRRPPRAPDETIPNRRGVLMILALGAYIGCATLWLFHHYLGEGRPQDILLAQTVAFTGIIVLEKVNVLNFRSLRKPISSVGWFTNKWLIAAIVGTVGLQACAVYVPFLQTLLHTAPLGWREWLTILAVSLPVFVITEIGKRIVASK
jgi:Ca2+-transporting ATPase